MFSTSSVLAHHQQCTRWPVYHVAVPAPRCHVSKCSIFVARGPGGLFMFFHQQHPRTPPNTQAPARASTARQDSRSSRRISAAVHAIPHAPLLLPSVFLAPPHAHSDSLFHAGPRTPFPLSAVVSQHAWRLSLLLQGSHPSLGRPFFLSTCYALRRAPRPPACTHARWCTRRRPTADGRTTRRAVLRRS